jgi:hypothetical protein
MKNMTKLKMSLVMGLVVVLASGCGSTLNAIPVTGGDTGSLIEQEVPSGSDVTVQEQVQSTETTGGVESQQIEEATPAPVIVEHVRIPSSPDGKPQVIHDQVSKDTAAQKQANGGDEFSRNRFERPFDQAMVYIPYLDITEANLVRGEDFLYFMVRTVESVATAPEAPMAGVELDLDLDGRGDFLLIARGPYTTEWTQTGVEVWSDGDNSVGSVTPVFNDDPFGSGDGYETKVFETGLGDDPDVAWVRLNPEDDTRVELALSTALFPEGQIFLWGAFVDGLIKDPAAFDYNDRFSLEEAGSAWKAHKDYPVKLLYAVDSTCRAPSNYQSSGSEPGVCFIAAPPAPERGGPPAPQPPPVKPPGAVIF